MNRINEFFWFSYRYRTLIILENWFYNNKCKIEIEANNEKYEVIQRHSSNKIDSTANRLHMDRPPSRRLKRETYCKIFNSLVWTGLFSRQAYHRTRKTWFRNLQFFIFFWRIKKFWRKGKFWKLCVKLD